MTTSSQTPGALPPEQPAVWPVPLHQAFAATGTAAAELHARAAEPAPADTDDDVPAAFAFSPDVPHRLRSPFPEPDGPECCICGNGPGSAKLFPDPRGRRYASGAQQLYCATCLPNPPAAEQPTPTPSPYAVVQAALADARRMLAETRAQLAVMAGAHRQRQAVLRLCEGRRGDDLLLVSAVAAAAEGGTTPYDGLPMTLTWARSVDVPEASDPAKRAAIHCESSYGGSAQLVVEGDDRLALASLLDAEIVTDPDAPCPNGAACGTAEDLDPSDPTLFGWVRVDVAGIETGPCWYCSPQCVSAALREAGAELAAVDQAADDLDARYGPGAADEYQAQVAEATADALADRDEDGDEL